MVTQSLSTKCSRCLGTGIDDNLNPSTSCGGCGGSGYTQSGMLDVTDLQADIDKILRRLKKIMDNLDINE